MNVWRAEELIREHVVPGMQPVQEAVLVTGLAGIVTHPKAFTLALCGREPKLFIRYAVDETPAKPKTWAGDSRSLVESFLKRSDAWESVEDRAVYRAVLDIVRKQRTGLREAQGFVDAVSTAILARRGFRSRKSDLPNFDADSFAEWAADDRLPVPHPDDHLHFSLEVN